MILGWWRRRRAARAPFPAAWRDVLRADVPFYTRLAPAVVPRFEERLKIFALTKAFIGAHGFTVDDRVRVVIAASAARLALYLQNEHYARLTEIIVPPTNYKHATGPGAQDGAVVFGEAHRHGTVVLSWEAVIAGMKNPEDGHDTALHEFAHVLDVSDGQFDGTPVLEERAAYAPWARVMSGSFLGLRGKKAKRKKHVLREYGATNEAEFFAVAAEAFFEKPRQLRDKHPELYALLADYFNCDPAAEVEAAAGAGAGAGADQRAT